MDNDTNPFGTFQPQPGPTFEDAQKANAAQAAQAAIPPSTAESSPPRRLRSSKRWAAAPTPASSAKTTEPAATPRRKYTRKATTQPVRPSTGILPPTKLQVVNELDIVMQIVDTLSHYDPKSKARILAAVARFS